MKVTRLLVVLGIVFTGWCASAEPVLRFTGGSSRSHIKLDSTPSQLQLANAPASFECWMYIESYNSDNMFYSKSSGSNYSHLFGIRGKGENMAAHNGTAYSLHKLSPAMGLASWHHVAFVCDGTTVSCYFDGVFKESLPFVYANTTTHTINLGGYNNGSDMKGRLSEIRVWGRARSGAEIRELRHVRLMGGDAGLLGYWPINEGGGTTIFDHSGNHSTGTTVNATEWVDDTALDTKLLAQLDFINSAPLVVADFRTGSTMFTSSNEVGVADFPVPDGYTEYQLTFGNTPAAIDGGGWLATSGAPVKLGVSLPAADTNLAWFAWFTNLTEEVTLRRAMADIIYTTAKPTAKVKAAFTRAMTPGQPAVLHLADINNGSNGGKVGGMADKLDIPLRSRTLHIDDGPADDATPDEPYLSLGEEGVYTIALVAENMAGNVATAMCEVTVSAYDGSAITWTGTQDSNWHEARNWDKRLVPPAGSPVVVNTGSIALSDSTRPLASFTMNGGTLTFSGWETALEAEEVMINGGTLTHPVQSDENGADGWTPDMRVNVMCTNFTLASGAVIDANGKGYKGGTTGNTTGRGPAGGAGTSSSAGHGGYGGAGTGITYGSPYAPEDAGSGGGSWSSSSAGNGGGVVCIAALESATINGTIKADGAKASGNNCGGGAGGSVYVTCRSLAGVNGMVTARGGDKQQYSSSTGGGGRIAVVYDSTAQAAEPVPQILFNTRPGSGDTFAKSGYIGTLYLPDNRLLAETILHSGQWVFDGFSNYEATSVTVSNAWFRFNKPGLTFNIAGAIRVVGTGDDFARLEVIPSAINCGTDLELLGSAYLHCEAEENALPDASGCGRYMTARGNLYIDNGATLYLYSHPANGASCGIVAENVNVGAGGSINADYLGFRGGTNATDHGKGPGGTLSYSFSGGAGHGGVGGKSGNSSAGGAVYGSETEPALPGSGSGYSTWGPGPIGARGGGLIRAIARRGINIDGLVTARGAATSSSHNSGGSGGGVFMKCRKFSGSGTLDVTGGAAGTYHGGGGGGGGRIALWAIDFDNDGTTSNIAGGVKGSGSAGADGSFYRNVLPFDGMVILLQ